MDIETCNILVLLFIISAGANKNKSWAVALHGQLRKTYFVYLFWGFKDLLCVGLSVDVPLWTKQVDKKFQIHKHQSQNIQTIPCNQRSHWKKIWSKAIASQPQTVRYLEGEASHTTLVANAMYTHNILIYIVNIDYYIYIHIWYILYYDCICIYIYNHIVRVCDCRSIRTTKYIQYSCRWTTHWSHPPETFTWKPWGLQWLKPPIPLEA